MAELNELHQLKKKQEKGVALSPEERARLEQLKKSEDLKLAVQQAQDMRNEMELKTVQVYSAEAEKKISSTFKVEEKSSSSVRTIASFESSAPSGIEAKPITTMYNIVASNKNESKTRELVVSQANVMASRTVEVAGAGFTV